jgi:hypothetical protein
MPIYRVPGKAVAKIAEPLNNLSCNLQSSRFIELLGTKIAVYPKIAAIFCQVIGIISTLED